MKNETSTYRVVGARQLLSGVSQPQSGASSVTTSPVLLPIDCPEQRRAYVARNFWGLDLRDQLVIGSNAQKKMFRPIYQFLGIFLAGYAFYHFRLPNLGYDEGGRRFAKQLLEVWMKTQNQPEEDAIQS